MEELLFLFIVYDAYLLSRRGETMATYLTLNLAVMAVIVVVLIALGLRVDKKSPSLWAVAHDDRYL